MGIFSPLSTLSVALLLGVTGNACAQAFKDVQPSSAPLILKAQGSFFVGGRKVEQSQGELGNLGPGGHIVVDQMYVHYMVPQAGDGIPVVMVHGATLTGKTWETTPDGRMGWDEYFVRRERSVYLADQVSRARSGFDSSVISEVKAGTQPPSALPNIIYASQQIAWTVFRFGPSFGKTFPDGQFPIESVDELYKQMIPDFNALLPNPNPTWKNMAALAVQLKGAILMGHSESGFFPQQAALLDPSGIRGMISIEMPCADLSAEQIAKLAKIPTLVMFGDYLGDVQGGPANWAQALESCNAYVKKVKDAGGDAVMMSLPQMGIKGNSHMLMQDRNSLQLADLIIEWIDQHVESQSKSQKAKGKS